MARVLGPAPEFLELTKRAPELGALGASVVAVSVDGIDTHRRWIAKRLVRRSVSEILRVLESLGAGASRPAGKGRASPAAG